jgi:hypothetical protein
MSRVQENRREESLVQLDNPHVHTLGTLQVHLDPEHVGVDQLLHTWDMLQVHLDPQHTEVEQQVD